MSAYGQSRHFDSAPLASGLPQLADILRVTRDAQKCHERNCERLPGIGNADRKRARCRLQRKSLEKLT
jgi:hypothetical protein